MAAKRMQRETVLLGLHANIYGPLHCLLFMDAR